MEYAEDIRKAIEEENRRAIDESTWGKPASDIITRIESMESAIPSRAIWEMVQNARDVSQREGADIIFRLGPNEFRFEHDGLPFTPKTLHSLNIQTSSKVRDDIIQVGQFLYGGRVFVNNCDFMTFLAQLLHESCSDLAAADNDDVKPVSGGTIFL